VFVFSLSDKNLLLLDRFHQAVSFPDSIFAITTQSGPFTVDFSCNDEVLTLDASDATRGIIGSVLETVWGVGSPSVTWNTALQQTQPDHLWGVGYTPWGPFSQSREISMSTRDAMLRNQVYTAIYESANHLSEIISVFKKYETGVADVLLPQEYVHFVRRFNVFNYKLDKAAMYLSLNNFNTSFYYARSLRHDVRALSSLFGRGSKYVHSHMACSQDEDTSFVRDTVFVSSVFVTLWVVFRAINDILHSRRNLKKRKD